MADRTSLVSLVRALARQRVGVGVKLGKRKACDEEGEEGEGGEEGGGGLAEPPARPEVVVSTIEATRRLDLAAVAVDGGGNLYITMDEDNTLLKVSGAGVVTRLAGGSEQGAVDGVGEAASFWRPTDVAVDADGMLYVADSNNHKIRKVTPEGRVTTLAGSGEEGDADGAGSDASFACPSGVVVDSEGCVYVADTNNHKIRKITREGVVTTLAGNGMAGIGNGAGADAEFKYPNGVAVDSEFNVYFTDWANDKIRKVSRDGVVTTLAGSGKRGAEDGEGGASSFNVPRGVAVDANGTVYVADTFNHKIRAIDAGGRVTTLAGTGAHGDIDGKGGEATFKYPRRVAIAPEGGALYVDSNTVVRRVACGSIGLPSVLLVKLSKVAR